MKTWKPLALASLFILFGRPACAQEVATEATAGKNRGWIAKSLEAHLLSVARGRGTVKVATDGAYGIGRWGTDWTKEFELKEGEHFYARPDHHSSLELKIHKIENDGVVIRYRSTFNHESFGKNLITVDIGEIKISFRPAGRRTIEMTGHSL